MKVRHLLTFFFLALFGVGLLAGTSLAQRGGEPLVVPQATPAPLFGGGNILTEVWIAAGQSQMLGVNFGRDASPGGVDRLPSNVVMLDPAGEIVPWHLPFETPQGAREGTFENLSPALTFLKLRAEEYPERRFVLVFVVRGASGFTVPNLPSQNWAAPTSPFYVRNNLTDLLVNRISSLRDRGFQPTGLIWLQGEADTLAGPSIYTSELTRFRQFIRDASGDPELPFVLSGIARFEWALFPGGSLIDAALLSLSAADPFSWFATTEDMVPEVDGLHFNGPSTRLLGLRYAAIVEEQIPSIIPQLAPVLKKFPIISLVSPPTILNQTILPGGEGLFDGYSEACTAMRDFESHRRPDGSFHLEATWPNGESVRWTQTSNPFETARDSIQGFAYLPDSPMTYPQSSFSGVCRTGASGLVLSFQRGRANLFTSGIGLFRFGAIDDLVVKGGSELLWTPGGMLVNSVLLRSL